MPMTVPDQNRSMYAAYGADVCKSDTDVSGFGE